MNNELSIPPRSDERCVYESARQHRASLDDWKWHGPYLILAVLDFETTGEAQLMEFLQHLAREIHDWKSTTKGAVKYSFSGLICVAPEEIYPTSTFNHRYRIRIWLEDAPLFRRAWNMRSYDYAVGLLWPMLLDSGVTFISHPKPVKGIIRNLQMQDASDFVIRQPSGLGEEHSYPGDMWFRLEGEMLERIASLATKLPMDGSAT